MAIFVHLIVEVGRSRAAAVAHQPYNISALYLHSLRHVRLEQVGIHGAVPIVVFQRETQPEILSIMPYKQPKIEKIYFTIGEVAGMFGVNTSLIRFWEREFDIIKPQKNKRGNRLFTQKDLDNLRIIFHLVKEEGLTLDGARRRLKNKMADEVINLEIVKSLENIKEMLLEVKNTL